MRISDWSSDVCSSDLLDNGKLTFVAANESRHAGAMSGTVRALVANMVAGVSKGFERKLTRSEESRVGKECAVRVDPGGSRVTKKKTIIGTQNAIVKTKNETQRVYRDSTKQDNI